MLTPISLARAKSASVLTPRRFRLKTPEQSPQSSHSAMADDKVERLAWSPLSSRTLSPEEEPSSMERERWTDATRAAARRPASSQEHMEMRLKMLERRVEDLEHHLNKEAEDSRFEDPVPQELRNDLFDLLRFEATKQASLLASKTEEQLAAADRQLTGLLSKAQALIQQSAEQMEEQLVRRSGQLLQAMKARPCGSDLAGRARGLQADQASESLFTFEDQGEPVPSSRSRRNGAEAMLSQQELLPSRPNGRDQPEVAGRGRAGPVSPTSPMRTGTSVAELMAKLPRG
ncbi:unnamed protein product [Durusdinium trenchii]|uniref:Uncharacterized protein n=1 Tax=Durusdinium trenchii TaxID=1381693 RepID=A0ABP0M0X5_9DINO